MSDEQQDIPIPVVVLAAVLVIGGIAWATSKPEDQAASAEAASADIKAPVKETAEESTARRAVERRQKDAADLADRQAQRSLLQAEQNAWNVLADPTNARFFDVKQVRVAEDTYAYCGSVEALNTLGGRTTEKFVAWWSDAAIESQRHKYAAAYETLCEGKQVVRVMPGFAWGG